MQTPETHKKPISFNGIMINLLTDNRFSINHTEKTDIKELETTKKSFSIQKAAVQYIGVNVWPDICAPVQLIDPGNRPRSTEEYTSLQKIRKDLKTTRTLGFRIITLDLDSAKKILTDSSFENATGMKIQLGYYMLMVDKNGDLNILHRLRNGKNKCQRIAR